jgi:hypothetical protein
MVGDGGIFPSKAMDRGMEGLNCHVLLTLGGSITNF